jgi:hypothetical protein
MLAPDQRPGEFMGKTLIAAGLACLLAAPAFGQVPASAYTRTDGEAGCTELELEEEEGFYFYSVCEGHAGWVLHIDGGEHGQRSTFRTSAEAIPGEERPTTFNYPASRGNFGHFHTVMEWRTAGEGGLPYAVIHRYYSQMPNDDGSWSQLSTLTVSALRTAEQGGTCMVGHIQATTLADANLVARDIADRYAPGFTCGTDRAVEVDNAYPTLDAALEAGNFINR